MISELRHPVLKSHQRRSEFFHLVVYQGTVLHAPDGRQPHGHDGPVPGDRINEAVMTEATGASPVS